MAEALLFILMDPDMKVMIVKYNVTPLQRHSCELHFQECGWITSVMAKVFTYMQMVMYMKVNGRKTRNMEKDYMYVQVQKLRYHNEVIGLIVTYKGLVFSCQDFVHT